MANTSPRPTIGTSTGVVTYVDAAGNLFPALVEADFAPASGTGAANTGSVDLTYVDALNPADNYDPNNETEPTRGRKILRANAVPDQGNAVVTTTPTGNVSSGSTSLTVSSATGIPASGFVTGVGIAQTTIANPSAAIPGSGQPATLPAGTPYTISGTTVTLGVATTAGLTSSTNLAFSAAPTNYWRYPTSYTI